MEGFAAFHDEQAKAFKRRQDKSIKIITGNSQADVPGTNDLLPKYN